MRQPLALIVSLFATLAVGILVADLSAQLQSGPPHQPPMVGDGLGGGSTLTSLFEQVTNRFHTTGFILSGTPGDPNAVLGFEVYGGAPNDFFTVGSGWDQSGDGKPDTFSMSEPLPPNEVPTRPPGFNYDGGTVVYTNSLTITQPVNGTFEDGQLWYADYSFSRQIDMVSGPNSGGVTRRLKISENNSPLPQDRLYFDYRFFNDVMLGFGDINRYVVGIEKMCGCGLSSFNLRVPFAATLDSDQFFEGAMGRDLQIGNLTGSYKRVLWQEYGSLLSGGLGVSVPTADDARIYQLGGPQIFEVRNRSVHLKPFLGWFSTNGISTLQMFFEVDFDLNGNGVFGDLNGSSLPKLGDLNDSNWMFLDIAYTRWLYQCESKHHRGITGFAPLVELHYSTTLNDTDEIQENGFHIRSTSRRYNVLNLTAGAHIRLGRSTFITPAGVVPLRESDDEQFRYELALLVNHMF